MTLTYEDFCLAKLDYSYQAGHPCELEEVNPMLFGHQSAIVKWAVEGGRRAIFAAFGIGKSVIQLEILRLVLAKSGGQRALIIAPLGVRQEFKRDANMLGFEVQFVNRTADAQDPGIYITNYESVRDGKLDVTLFDAVSLDEAAVLRSFGSKTYIEFLQLFKDTPYRYVATATPSPNKYKELIHYAGFLGIMDTGSALAQPLSAKLLTPTGWTNMGSIAVGDSVISVDGSAASVLGVYPQGEKPIYRVEFSDGTSTRCTGDHLWLTQTQYERNNATRYARRNPGADPSHYWTVKSTDDIAKSLRNTSTGSLNHMIPMVRPIEFEPNGPLPVDPWLIGALIGDGHLHPSSSPSLTTADEWIADRANKAVAPMGLHVVKSPHVRKNGEPNYSYNIVGIPGMKSGQGNGHRTNALNNELDRVGLRGCRAWEKFIPDEYKFGSIEDRLALLQGLMDTDGTVAKNGLHPHLITTSKQLALDVQFIVQSLGGTSTIANRKGVTPTGRPGRDQFHVSARLHAPFNPFAMPRKADRYAELTKYLPKRYVSAIAPDGTEDAQCIAVDHPDRLYVTDNCLVTHNTKFFQRDSTQANNLTLYPHKEREFWLWLASWSVFLQRPSDLGFSDDGYIMPPIEVVWHELPVDHHANIAVDKITGQSLLFRDQSLGVTGASQAKRDSLNDRIDKAVELVNASPDDHFILWHDLEDERHAIKKALPGAVEIFGSLDIDERERRIVDFSDGGSRILATKPILSGSGCNFQRHCHRAIFVGVGFKFSDFIQAVHRIQRYGQTKPVRIDIIYTEHERSIKDVLLRKWETHKELTGTMSQIIIDNGLAHIRPEDIGGLATDIKRVAISGERWTLVNNDTVDECARIASQSIDLIVSSIPFGNQYGYVNNVADFGHNLTNGEFWKQMDYLWPNLLRILKPGRIFACHVKDRIEFGNVTGKGVPTVAPFHAEATLAGIRHGFQFMGMVTVATDVVRENNQTYRLGWSEHAKDATKMGVGCPEYILLFRAPQTDLSRGYADVPVVHPKDEYSIARWQVDAHAFWPTSGDRLLSAEELLALPVAARMKAFREWTSSEVYDYQAHVELAEALGDGLSKEFMMLAPASKHPHVWTDINRMITLNSEQRRRNVEMHVCPLQIEIVDRLIEQFSMPSELVFDPFAGIGTVPHRALKLGRRGAGVELNAEYFKDARRYCEMAAAEAEVPTLFDCLVADEVA